MASALTPRSAVLAVGVGLLLAGVIVFTAQKTGILEGPDGPRVLFFGTLATVIAGRAVYGLLARRGQPPPTRRTWRDMKPSDPLYRAWRGLRERQRLFVVVLLVGFLARGGFALAGLKMTNKLTSTPGPVDAGTLEHLESTVRRFCYADSVVAIISGAALVYAAHRLGAWPCPRCGEPFVRHRRRWYAAVAFAFTLAVAVPFAAAGWAFNANDRWLMLLFVPRVVYLTVHLVLWSYVLSVVIHRHRDNYARRTGDPDWRKKTQGYCVHCGLPAWSPSRSQALEG